MEQERLGLDQVCPDCSALSKPFVVRRIRDTEGVLVAVFLKCPFCNHIWKHDYSHTD